MDAYPHLSEHVARVFARHASALQASAGSTGTTVQERLFRLAERYKEASHYLQKRCGIRNITENTTKGE